MFTLSHNLILGSKSPRRQELIKGMGFEYEIRTLDTDESYPSTLLGTEVAGYLATQKADALMTSLLENELLLTSDTVVIIEGEVLGKPADKDEAIAMLSKLSGKTHQVITGVHLATTKQRHTFSVTTEVVFHSLQAQEIEYYVQHYKPFDKAGSYGIQEWIGYVGIEKMNGSYYNVMGLPTAELWQQLRQLGYIQS
jgi:septum formation protein